MRAVAFDVDGVLLDTLSAHQRVWGRWAAAHGLDVDVVWRATFGRRPEDTIADVGLDPAVERPVLDRLLAEHEDAVAAMPGARELIAALGSAPWALVTSGNRGVTTARFRRLGLPLPAVAVCGEDVAHGKPHPECYLAATCNLGVAPADCLVIEDAPAGIAAGNAAGCRVLAVATTCAREELTEADEVYGNLEELAARARLPYPP